MLILNEQKRGIFLYVRIPWLSELHFLELLTDQFSVLEAFPIPNLPVEFSQEGAADVREITLGCVLNQENHFSTNQGTVCGLNFAFWKQYNFQDLKSLQ